ATLHPLDAFPGPHADESEYAKDDHSSGHQGPFVRRVVSGRTGCWVVHCSAPRAIEARPRGQPRFAFGAAANSATVICFTLPSPMSTLPPLVGASFSYANTVTAVPSAMSLRVTFHRNTTSPLASSSYASRPRVSFASFNKTALKSSARCGALS